MRKWNAEHEWKPVGVDKLDDNALNVVRSNTNTLVLAGPGAGKTELLAQRASFLLTTGRCPSPRRILAISFKVDAAGNLAKRVRERCGDLARRFDSMTLDAFAKSLVDRFRLALPEEWRPGPSYHVRTEPFTAEEARHWLKGLPVPKGHERPPIDDWSDNEVRRVLVSIIHGSRLPYNDDDTNELRRHWGPLLWKDFLSKSSDEPSLTFPMLNRLAAYLLRCNAKIADALRATYAYVFMDEFQDTTHAQWDLVVSAFKGSSTIVTAVGDDKQRIMLWAGAMPDAFRRFQKEFKATPIRLARNYRSVPELVEIQNQIARAMLGENATATAVRARTGAGACWIWKFADAKREAEFIAQWIRKQVIGGTKSPNDFCVLARQHVGTIIRPLQRALAAHGLRLRDESFLQDLREEPVTQIVVNSIRLAVRGRDPDAWANLLQEISYAVGLDESEPGARLERLAVKHWKAAQRGLSSEQSSVGEAIRQVIDVLGHERYREVYPRYSSERYFDEIIDRLRDALEDGVHRLGDVSAAVDDFLGVNVIPAMTIHKSKGLEFDTVILIGLEDGQWWNFPNQPEEEKRAFFVAFSRAIRRVIFTYCELRSDPSDGRVVSQARDKIGSLYDVLQSAGVEVMSPDEDRRFGEFVRVDLSAQYRQALRQREVGIMSAEREKAVQYVNQCPRCNNEDFSPGAQYCKRCGLRLYNTCTNEECGVGASSDAAYCEMCGHETYYNEQGVVAPWRPPLEFSEDDIPF